MRRAQPWLTNRSRELRDQASSAEQKLWHRLRNRQLAGFKFVRQEPIGPYFGDFACRECKLIVEVDGGTHATETERRADEQRTRDLERLGYRIIRLWNDDVHQNISGALDMILGALQQDNTATQDGMAQATAPHPAPLPIASEGRWGEGSGSP